MLNKSHDKILKNAKTIVWAFILWSAWVLFYALVMYFQVKDIPPIAALISSANLNYVFAMLSIIIWFICRAISYEKIPKLFFVLLHFTLGIFFSALWLFITYGAWYLAQGKVIFELVGIREIIGWQFLFGMITYFLITGIFYTIIYYRNFKKEQLREAELKALTREAELMALKLQINPHFLFNSLNSINALVTQNPVLARQMIAKLSDLFRISLESHDKFKIPLKEELDLVHAYLDIEKIRFKDKMEYHEEIGPELLTRSFPAMLLQPLLENAIKHGIASRRTGGTIELLIKDDGGHFKGHVINRSNDDSSYVADIANNGMGLSNIRQRLDRLYGAAYKLQIDQSEANVFKVSFDIPIE